MSSHADATYFFFSDRQQVRSSDQLMPQNQPSGRGLLPSSTAWSPDQQHAAMLVEVSPHIRRDLRTGIPMAALPYCSWDHSKDRSLRHTGMLLFVCWLVACLTSQQHASVSQGRICSDNFTCCHTDIEIADQTFYLTQSQYTDPGQTSPSTDPIMPGAWQGSHWSANF